MARGCLIIRLQEGVAGESKMMREKTQLGETVRLRIRSLPRSCDTKCMLVICIYMMSVKVSKSV